MKAIHILLAILVPPLGVLLTYGLSVTLLINLALTLLFYVPGMIHGLWAVTKHYEKLEAGARS